MGKRAFGGSALAAFLATVAACIGEDVNAGGGSTGSGTGTGTNASTLCKYKDPGTTFAPCKSDSDCYSGFCDETGNPGPYCWASSSALAEGRGIACSDDDDCVVPAEAAARGIRGGCGGSNIAQNYCDFACRPDAGTGGGGGNGGGGGSGTDAGGSGGQEDAGGGGGL